MQETENEDIKKMRELSSELDKMTKEMEDSKEALEKKHIENLQIKVSIFLLSFLFLV